MNQVKYRFILETLPWLLGLLFLMLSVTALKAQEKVEIEGAIKIGNNDNSIPEAGTIRWTGTDFEGWNGSSWISLTGGPCDGLNIVKDIEANTYPTVGIGAQCWTAVNLRTTMYNDGTPIPHEPASTDWGTLITPAFCWYNDNIGNASPFGALYNWYVVDTLSNGGKNVCPAGWHVPSESEYAEMINYLGGENLAGIKLKEAGNVHFLSSNETATNLSGFTAMPAGYRVNTSFYEKGYYAQYWTTTPSNATQSFFVDIEYDGEYAYLSDQNKNRGNSIRCVKD